MVVLTILIKHLVKLLKSESSPAQIAAGFILGMFLGFLSLKTLFAFPILLVIILFKVNLASVLFSALLFRLIAYLLDPILNAVGYYLLVNTGGLHRFWVNLYSIPLMPYTRFNNTIVMGGLVISLILSIPLYIAVKVLVRNYRIKYEDKIKKWKIIKILSASRVVRWISGLGKIGV